eukprot:jgi/Psemu1/253636/estExt_Genewise1Plus.C_740055
MTSSVRVLSTQTLDSSPSILLVAPNGKKTLVNCGEGCQRIFLEFGQKVATIDRVCLTHLGHATIGGLPGMILTASDVLKQATDHAKQAAAGRGNRKDNNNNNNNNNTSSSPIQPGLKLLGPSGTYRFFRSLRHFMRRDSFWIDIQEECVTDSMVFPPKKRPRIADTEDSRTIAAETESEITETIPQQSSPRSRNRRQILSFLFTTPPIQGKFLIEQAKALGVPKGPLYGQLKAGKAVTFSVPSDGGGESATVTVESHQVVEPGSPGVVVAILCYPSFFVLDQLRASEELIQFQRQTQETNAETDNASSRSNPKKKQKGEKKPVMELVIHMTTSDIFQSDTCASWRASFFQEGVRHMFLNAETTNATSMEREAALASMSAFQSAHSGALLRSQVSSDVYRAPTQENLASEKPATTVPLLEYVLLPRSKRGFCNHDLFHQKWNTMKEDARLLLDTSDCVDRAKKILEESQCSPETTTGNDATINGIGGEILFTGTGSAVPCKHRNVSGIHVRMNNGNAMLLDVGEGTVGQLLRAKQHEKHRGNGKESLADVLKQIKAIWISHPHADHHLGIIRLLEERQRLVSGRDPVVLIAPPNILNFLREYESVEPSVADSYLFLDCRALKAENGDQIHEEMTGHLALQRLQQDLGIHSCTSIPVAHCAHSFAVVFHGTSFGSLAYSGDCRPSKNFSRIAYDADLLIHEATFADGLEADALVKRHCTVGEALHVAKEMNAKTTILTHFSQRYPKIPVLSDTCGTQSIIHAFDFMTVTPSNIALASKLTPALQLLYPDESDDAKENETTEMSDAQAALEVPGLFAQSELL